MQLSAQRMLCIDFSTARRKASSLELVEIEMFLLFEMIPTRSESVKVEQTIPTREASRSPVRDILNSNFLSSKIICN
ncbi:hypothetical protein PanWU01x14_271890 [Parasponia andersonii]|uniref:Uncharacterized protein n=1 Tax=Parasponia andersonii TaxID=3476 RepID=A0A2P5B4N9_PARAD|nr:hypothetical protein PanWU01x14_271890 [Parasponia andersonii]